MGLTGLSVIDSAVVVQSDVDGVFGEGPLVALRTYPLLMHRMKIVILSRRLSCLALHIDNARSSCLWLFFSGCGDLLFWLFAYDFGEEELTR